MQPVALPCPTLAHAGLHSRLRRSTSSTAYTNMPSTPHTHSRLNCAVGCRASPRARRTRACRAVARSAQRRAHPARFGARGQRGREGQVRPELLADSKERGEEGTGRGRACEARVACRQQRSGGRLRFWEAGWGFGREGDAAQNYLQQVIEMGTLGQAARWHARCWAARS
eukprot:235408-Chlamydomonas_euryale.AAC.1